MENNTTIKLHQLGRGGNNTIQKKKKKKAKVVKRIVQPHTENINKSAA